MPIPVLLSERLRLRPFTRADAADVFAFAANPNVSRYTAWGTHRTIEDSHEFIDMVLGRQPDEFAWAICLHESPAVIGVVEFGPCDAAEARVDYVLDEPYWNKGLTTEAVRTVLAWGLKHCPRVQSVASSAMAQNIGSQRVMQKSGLVFDRAQSSRWSKFREPVLQHFYKLIREPLAAG